MGQNERGPAEKYDVVIVGSGPEAASAARALTGREPAPAAPVVFVWPV
jgi:ribulose 1,5-bisphosphate synthetase/thiazole synthase